MPNDGAPFFETRPLGPIGVELAGLDLGHELSPQAFGALRATVVEEGLVLLRDQRISPEAHTALGRRFGELEDLSPGTGSDGPGMVVIGNVDGDGNVLPSDSPFMKLISINEGWHTDSSFRPVPASFSLFAAVVVPPEGGDTFYASLRHAWDALGESERAALVGLRGIHDYAAAYRRRGSTAGSIVGFDSEPIAHPLVRKHPETGRPGLYVSEHVARIEGMPEGESRALLERLLAHCTRPETVHRQRWRTGDFMIWDNRSMLHRAQGFDGRNARVMHHVRVAGDGAPIPA